MEVSLKKKQFFYIFIILVCLIIFIFAIYNIFMLYFNYKKDIKILTEISNSKSTQNNNNTIILDDDFLYTDFIDVDFDNLKSINDKAIGWIQVEGTDINYPFVQTSNNDYYLNHSFYNKYNPAGWVFLDYRNKPNFEDKNTILYAHSQNNKTMFGSLKNTLKNNWLNNKNNHIIRISTENQNSIWQIFSIYIIPTTNDYLKISFDNDFSDFTKKILDRSIYDLTTNITDDDKILTLSTCYNKEDKLVLHSKLVKIQEKSK